MVIGVIVDVMTGGTGIDDALQQDKDDPSN